MDELREKVIEHLADCVEYLDGDSSRHWVFVRGNAVRAALQLLKAQEPRVMTLEEVKAWNKRNVLCREPIFLEDRYSFAQHWTLDEIGGMALEKYGDITLCWTSRPTDEQRKAVKWE